MRVHTLMCSVLQLLNSYLKVRVRLETERSSIRRFTAQMVAGWSWAISRELDRRGHEPVSIWDAFPRHATTLSPLTHSKCLPSSSRLRQSAALLSTEITAIPTALDPFPLGVICLPKDVYQILTLRLEGSLLEEGGECLGKHFFIN